MKGKKSRLLVVDASIVRAAGKTEHPVSSACRNCLNTILEICHRVILTPAIREEWNRHQSRFASKWRVSMCARKKILSIDSPGQLDLKDTGASPKSQESIEKDRGLLDAAMFAERIIITGDDAVRSALAGTNKGANILKRLKWINPVADGVAWLENPKKA